MQAEVAGNTEVLSLFHNNGTKKMTKVWFSR